MQTKQQLGPRLRDKIKAGNRSYDLCACGMAKRKLARRCCACYVRDVKRDAKRSTCVRCGRVRMYVDKRGSGLCRSCSNSDLTKARWQAGKFNHLTGKYSRGGMYECNSRAKTKTETKEVDER